MFTMLVDVTIITSTAPYVPYAKDICTIYATAYYPSKPIYIIGISSVFIIN